MSFSSLLDNNKTTSSEATNIKANKTVFSSALDNKKDSSFSSSLTQNTDTALSSTAEQPKTDASFSLALHKPKKENFLTQTKLGYGLLGKATVGQLQFVEGLWDVTVGSIGSALGNKDMINMSYGSNWTRDANKWLDDLYGMDSSDGGWNTYGDIMLGVGQQLPSIVANIASWGSASGVMALLQGLSAAGQSTSSAYETTGKAGLGEHVYGAIMGGADYGLEMITGGFGKLGKAVASSFGKTASKTALNAVAKQITAKAVAKGVIKEALGEAFEEGTEEFIDPYVQRITGVNPEAENATPEEIGYSAFVGGMSALLIGGAGGSVATANNLRTGNKVVNENRIDTVIESNKQFAEYAKTKDSSIGALQTSLALREEYDKIKAKEGDKVTQRQRYLLGEMETNNVMLATLPSIMQSKKNILNNAEKYAEAYNSMNYKNKDGSPYVISADEIRTNDNIATVLAVTDFANGLYKPFKGTEIYGDMDEVQYMNWQNSAPDEQIAEVSKYFGADMGKADYRYYTANKENASRKYGSESIYAKAHDIREFRPSDIKDNETGVYKAENGVILSIRKVDDNYTIVATDINGNGLGGTKQPVDYATIRKYVNRFSDLPSMKAETENTAKAEADRRTVLKHAQKTIEGFDLLSREIRTSILNSYIVGDRMNVDTESVDSYARVSAKLGIAITFADINTDGYYNYISAGKDMIYINPNGSRSLERVFTHEGYHSIYDTTEGQAIARMADAYYSTEEAKSRKEEIETRYREFASNPDNNFNLTPEIMREELSAHFIEDILADKDFIMQLGKEQPKGIKRLLSNVTDLMNYFKAKDKKAYQALLQLRKLYASGLVTNNTINSIMGDKKKNEVSFALTGAKRMEYKQYLVDLGRKRIQKNAGDKKIYIQTNNFTVNKNIYSNSGRTKKEVNARLKAIRYFDTIIRSSVYSHTDTNIRGVDTEAKKGVIAIHFFKAEYNGYDVELVVCDKGIYQFLYEVKFIDKTKKDSQQSVTTVLPARPHKGDAENHSKSISNTADKVNTFSEKKINKSSKNSFRPAVTEENQEIDKKYLSTVENGNTVPKKLEDVFFVERRQTPDISYMTPRDYLERIIGKDISYVEHRVDNEEPNRLAKINRALQNGTLLPVVRKGDGVHRAVAVGRKYGYDNVLIPVYMKSQLEEMSTTRYAVSESDAEYLEVVQKGDMETAQRMVDEAANTILADSEVRDRQKKLERVWHFTTADFNVFKQDDLGLSFFSTSPTEYLNVSADALEKVIFEKDEWGDITKVELFGEDITDAYNGDITQSYEVGRWKVSPYYLNCKKLFRKFKDKTEANSYIEFLKQIDVEKASRISDSNKGTKDYIKMMEYDNRMSFHEILEDEDLTGTIISDIHKGVYTYREIQPFIEWLKKNNYDGLTVLEIEDGEVNYAVFSSSQAKSTDPVTYDDKGEVIPLSKRFDSANEDIRYAVSVDQVERDIRTLPGTTVNPVPFDRDTINNTAFADLVNEAIKEMEIREKQYQEGTSTRRRDNILGGKKRAYDREKLDRIRELGERKRQPETIEQQRELAQFLVDYGGTETIQYGLRNITVVKPEYMPTYQREVVNKFASTGRKANFFIGKAYRNGVLGWFSPSKGEVYIGMDNSANSIAIVNHENFHALRRNKNYFQSTVDFMKSVRETAKKAGNDYKDIISTMKSSYPSLRNDPFNRGSQAIDVVMENSLLEEFCCELIAGDVKTDNKDLLRLREEFILNNQNVFFPDVDTDVLHVTDPAYNTAKDELRNTVSEIAETNVSRNTPVDNNVNPPIISNETTIEKVRGVMPVTEETRKERAKRTVTALQISLTNATAGIEKYLKSKGRANYEEVTNMARKARAKTDFALTQGLYSFTDNSKLAKSYKEVFTWLETKYNRDTDKANYVKYKREFNDYMLHRHNVDRMNQFEDLSVSEIESLKISGETKKALTEYAQKNKLNSLTHETVLFVADNDVDIKEIEGFTRVIKPVFGKYLYFDTIAKQRIDDIKRDFPKFYDAIENAGTLSEADVYELLSAEMDTEKTATAKMITDYLVQVSAEDSKKRIAEIDQVHPEFSEHAQDVVDYSRGLLRLSWEAGNISYDTYQTLTKMYPNYVPTIRDTNGSIAVGGSAKTFSGSRVSQIVKRASGSDLVIMPIDNMLARRTEQIFSAWAINDVANALYETADNDAVRIVDEQRITKVPDIDYVTELVDPNRKDNKEFTLVFYRGGNLVSMSVRDDIYKGIYSLNDHNLKYNEIIQRVMYESMNFFKKSVTSYNPFFLIRNFLRDIQDATLYSKHGLGKIILNLPSAIKEMTADGDLWQEYRMNGGLSSSVFDYTYGLKEFAEKGAVKRIYDKSLGRIVNPAVDFIERANVFTEQLTRFSEYMLARKNNLTIDSAMLQSDDVTVNFGRSGTLTKTANKFLFPFLNAKVQGFSKFFKTVTSRKTVKEIGSLLVRIGLLGLLPALINAIMYKDDEDYKDLAYYVKDNYYLFKIGDKFIKIPKGRILSLFGGGTTRTWDFLMNDDKEAYKGYAKEIWENLSPVDGVRSIFDPVSDVATNTSWYGSDIESQSMQNKYVKDRYDESTSAISIAIGQVTSYVGLSPAKVDYLLDQYSGVWGDIILPLTSKSAKTSFLTKDYLIDVAKSTKVVSAFYDCIEQETYAKNSGELASAGALKYLGSVKNDLNELYEQRKSISLSNLSQSDINGQTKTIQLLINTTAKTAVVNADEIKKLLANAKLTEDNYEEEYYKALRTVMGSEYAMLKYNKEAYYKMTSFKAVGINSDTYYDYYFNTKDITADVDKKGNTIGGSRKKKVLKYLATIKGLSTAQKILLIYASGFSVKDNEIKGLTKKKALSSVTAYLNKQKLTDVDREYFAKLFDLKIRNKRLVV